MAIRSRGDKRRFAFEQLEDRRLLSADPIAFQPDFNFDALDHAIDVRLIVLLEAVAVGAENKFETQNEAGSAYSLTGFNSNRIDDQPVGNSDFGQDGDDQDSERDAVDHQVTGFDQNQNDDADTDQADISPSGGSTGNGMGELVGKSLSENAATGEGERSVDPSDQAVESADRNSDKPVSADSLTAPPLDPSEHNSSATLAAPTADRGETAHVASGDDARSDLMAAEISDQSRPSGFLPDAMPQEGPESHISTAEESPQQRLTSTSSALPPRTEQTHDEQMLEAVCSLLTGMVGKIVPATGSLVTAGLSPDVAALDAAMNQLLEDLQGLHSDAAALIENVPVSAWALSATVGLIAAEIIRRRRRNLVSRTLRDNIDDQLTVWMYPECSGLSGTPAE
ncbi:MAG: LEPR-XLL domain-containing protein [Pirellulaceae bacterium]